MSLKTDYVDAVYTGDKKYTITDNGDGTSTITDSTAYEQEGTRFGAKDINDINAAVNEHVENKENPHEVTAAQVGAAEKDHTHTASDVGAAATSHTHTKSQITDFPTSMAPTVHNQAASTITTGTFNSTATYAKSGTDYTTYRIRNSAANTTAMTAGSTALTNGNVYLQYS